MNRIPARSKRGYRSLGEAKKERIARKSLFATGSILSFVNDPEGRRFFHALQRTAAVPWFDHRLTANASRYFRCDQEHACRSLIGRAGVSTRQGKNCRSVTTKDRSTCRTASAPPFHPCQRASSVKLCPFIPAQYQPSELPRRRDGRNLKVVHSWGGLPARS